MQRAMSHIHTRQTTWLKSWALSTRTPPCSRSVGVGYCSLVPYTAREYDKESNGNVVFGALARLRVNV